MWWARDDEVGTSYIRKVPKDTRKAFPTSGIEKQAEKLEKRKYKKTH